MLCLYEKMCFIDLILLDLFTFSMQFFQRWEVIKDSNDPYHYHSTNSDLQVYPLTRIPKLFACSCHLLTCILFLKRTPPDIVRLPYGLAPTILNKISKGNPRKPCNLRTSKQTIVQFLFMCLDTCHRLKNMFTLSC